MGVIAGADSYASLGATANLTHGRSGNGGQNTVENVLGVSRKVQTGDAGNMNAYAIASILSILTLAGWAVSYKER